MNRLLFCAILLVVVQASWSQDLSRKISVEIPASRAKVAIPALGKAAGLTMEAAANLADEVFVISAKDASIDDIMKRVAKAEAGSWKHEDGQYILTRDHSVTVVQERKELADRAKLVTDAIAKLNGSVEKEGKFDQAAAQALADEAKKTFDQFTPGQPPPEPTMRVTPDKTPVGRAVSRLLNGIDPAKLAEIGANQRVVFSTNPTPVQLSFGNGAENAFTELVQEQQLYTQAYNGGQDQGGNVRTININGLTNPRMGPGDPRLGIGLGLMVVERRFGNILRIQILTADPHLETITSGSFALVLSRPQTPASGTAGDPPIKLSADAQELAKAIYQADESAGPGAGGQRSIAVSSSGGPGGPGGGFSFSFVSNNVSNVKISPELRAKILNPEKYEPLAYIPGEAMLALGRAEGKNLVALLPDYCFGSLTRQFGTDVTASALLASLAPTHSLAAAQEDSWIVVSPGLPATGRAETVDRPALGVLLRALDKNGQFSLDDLCNFAVAQTKVPGLTDIDFTYARLINTTAADADMSPLATGSYSLFRFYGTLTSGQGEVAASGRPLAFMNLSPDQLSLISDMLYNDAQNPNVQSPGQGQSQRPQGQSFTFAGVDSPRIPIMMGGPISASTERTIVVPNGVGNGGFLVGVSTSQPVVQAIMSSTGASTFYDASSLAFVRSNSAQQVDPEFAAPAYDKYRMAHRSFLTLTFTLNPRVTMTRSLHDVSFDPGSSAGSYDSLPADFRQQVQQAANNFQRTFQKVGGFGGANRTPPP